MKARRLEVATAHWALTCVSCLLVVACGGAPPAPKAPAVDHAAAFLNDLRPSPFHSARFELRLPLPDGPGWRIDDHSAPQLVATHPGTDSRLTLQVSFESDLMNRQRCEALAHERGLIQDDAYQTVDDEVIKGPGPYDSHVSVEALPSPVPHRTTSGHVLLYGAYMKKCLFFHYETPLRQGEDEETLSARLAVVRLQVLGAIRVDSFDKPDVRQTH